MYVHAKSQPEIEFLKWVALLLVAGALALLLVGTALGAAGVRPPGLLPPDFPAEPMPYPPSDRGEIDTPRDPFGLTAEIWNAIELQKSGNIDAAIEVWENMRLPRDTENWRLLMLGVAYMQVNELGKAVAALEQSQDMVPDNPVVYYALGLVAMSESMQADEWYDALNVDPNRLAAYTPTERIPLTRSMYRLAATMAFERAIELAPYVDLDQTLLPEAWVVPEETGRIRTAFVRILGRPATEQELNVCTAFLAEQTKRLSNPGELTRYVASTTGEPEIAPAELPADRAWEDLVHVLLNHNDFITIR